jgi:hypothetical protein
MIYEEDFELVAHLRRVTAEPQPAVPSGVYAYVDRVAAGEIANPTTAWPRRSRSAIRFPAHSKVAAIIGLAATFVLAASATLLLAIGQQNSPVPAATPPSTAIWSALEWHDITATAFPPTTTATGEDSVLRVANRGGESYATTSLGGPLWSSTDGMNWQQVSGAPSLDDLLATPDFLLGESSPQPQCGSHDSSGRVQISTCSESSVVWFSRDGHSWNRSSLQLPAGHIVVSWAAVGSAVVVLAATQDLSTPFPAGVPSLIYLSTDGADWKQVAPPAAMAGAINCVVTATRAGFLFTGGVADPTGPQIMSASGDNGSFSFNGYIKSWASSDGSSWTPYAAQTSSGSSDSQPGPILQGSRGDVVDVLLHSADGVIWSYEPPPTGQFYFFNSLSSNGSQIVGYTDGPAFGMTLGDGRWQLLQNIGKMSNLPGSGEAVALPGGVLYDAGGHVYFGRAIADVAPAESLTPTSSVVP